MDRKILAAMGLTLLSSASIAAYHKFFYKHEGIRSAISPRDAVLHVNDSISFRDLTVGAERRVWDFGDGEFSAEESGRHIYVIPGHFRVHLSSYGVFGTLKDSSTEIIVLPGNLTASSLPASSIEGEEMVATGQPVNYHVNISAGAYDWQVEGDAGLANSRQNGNLASYRFTSAGLKTLVLTMHNPDQTLRKQIMVQNSAPPPMPPAANAMPPAPDFTTPAGGRRKGGSTSHDGNHHTGSGGQNSSLPELGDGVILDQKKKPLPEE